MLKFPILTEESIFAALAFSPNRQAIAIELC